MSETPIDPNRGIPLQDSLIAFTGCVGEAVPDICSYGLTMGETYVPFDPDPEDDCPDEDAACSQVWVRVMTVVPTYQADGFGGECGSILKLSLEVGVIRCLDVPAEGAAPTASEVLIAAMQAMEDMNAIYCAAMNCEVWDSITSGEWVPSGPMGGQYGGTWTFDVEATGWPAPIDLTNAPRGMWTGHGPPPEDENYMKNGDEYVDLDTGDVYEISR